MGSRHREDGQPGDDTAWQRTPWARLLMGLLLSQGMYYVLRHLCVAGLLVAEERAGTVWATLTGLLILQGLQAISVLAAGVLIGAAQRQGFLYGAMVGFCDAGLFLVVQQWLGQPPTPVTLFGLPVLQAAFGALGGVIGSSIWKPVPLLAMPTRFPMPGPKITPRSRASSFAGPVAWGRVLLGILLAVAGGLWAGVIRDGVMEASEGKLRIDTHLQAELVTWEISALAVLLGAGVAGATLGNGSKQGIYVGVGTLLTLLGVRMATGHFVPEETVLTVAGTLILGLSGGWFGSQLLPPVVRSSRKRDLAFPL
jgi:hypothetical protein